MVVKGHGADFLEFVAMTLRLSEGEAFSVISMARSIAQLDDAFWKGIRAMAMTRSTSLRLGDRTPSALALGNAEAAGLCKRDIVLGAAIECQDIPDTLTEWKLLVRHLELTFQQMQAKKPEKEPTEAEREAALI